MAARSIAKVGWLFFRRVFNCIWTLGRCSGLVSGISGRSSACIWHINGVVLHVEERLILTLSLTLCSELLEEPHVALRRDRWTRLAKSIEINAAEVGV